MEEDKAQEYIGVLRAKWRLLRLRAGLATVRQAAEKTGVSKALIAVIEKPTGHVPTLETLVKLAWGYGVDPAEMVTTTLPANPYIHLGDDWQGWLTDPKNLPALKRAWLMDLLDRRPDLREQSAPPEFPEEMRLFAWAADPENRTWLKTARAMAAFEQGEVGLSEVPSIEKPTSTRRTED